MKKKVRMGGWKEAKGRSYNMINNDFETRCHALSLKAGIEGGPTFWTPAGSFLFLFCSHSLNAYDPTHIDRSDVRGRK